MFIIPLIWFAMTFVIFLAMCVAVMLAVWGAYRMFRRTPAEPLPASLEEFGFRAGALVSDPAVPHGRGGLATLPGLERTPTRFDGIASLLDLGHTLRPPLSVLGPAERDRLAIAADWAVVGGDLRVAAAAGAGAWRVRGGRPWLGRPDHPGVRAAGDPPDGD